MGLIEYSAEMKEATTYSGDPRGCSEATTDSMPRKREKREERRGTEERGGAEEDVATNATPERSDSRSRAGDINGR
jgi:hypothetical protein